MAIVLKRRARKLLAQGEVISVDRYPNGVGGIEGHAPCTSFSVGNITVIFIDTELRKALKTAGYAIVPREPTEKMLGLWADVGNTRDKAAGIWRAMVEECLK